MHFQKSKFQYLIESDHSIDDENNSIGEFHFLLNSLVISNIYYNKGQYRGDIIATSVLIDSQKDEDNEENESLHDIIDSHIPHGFGSWKFIDENSNEIFYKGEWRNGKKEGHGTLQTSEIYYEGEWKENEMFGFGIFRILKGFHQGSVYYGYFSHGKRNGFGIQFYKYEANGEILLDEYGNEFNEWYRGEWLNDVRCGKGEFKSKYEWKCGDWKKHELRDGIGCIKECLEKQDSIVTNCIHSNVEFEKFSQTSRKSHIPSTILPHIFSLEHLDKLTMVDAIIAYGNQTKAPKRTIYNGYCFRSKLESRWAKFFESCSIHYEYECKTFVLKDGTSYTPDFYLPFHNFWIEIKPNYPSEEERVKAQLLTLVLQSSSGATCSSPYSNKNNETSSQQMKEFEKKHERHVKSNPRIFILYGDVSAPFIKKFQSGAMAIEFFKGDQQQAASQSQQERISVNILMQQNRTNKRVTPPRGASTSNSIRESVQFNTVEPLGWCQCHHCGRISLEYRCKANCCLAKSNSKVVDSVVTSELGATLSGAFFAVSKLSFDEWRVKNENVFFNSITPEVEVVLEKKRSKFF